MPISSQSRPKGKHGGKRPGAGRKPRTYTSPTSLSPLDQQALMAGTPPAEIETLAQSHAMAAVGALVKCTIYGASDASRVAAARAILDRGYAPELSAGTPTAAIVTKVAIEARKHANVAIQVLRRIAEFGQSEGAAVAAAKSLLERGLGPVGLSKVPDPVKSRGKREQADEDAQSAATGVFETPKAPKRVMQ